MAISRSLMNRQLRADGGIMQVAPREKFGLGSSIKKFVRKIIPNEVSEIAVKAAPFVAPFNPAVAAAMSGLGTFDQTGSIGDSLKGGALTYGLGQGARYLGGAGFQGNPFAADGGAFRGGLEGFKSGFTSPLGNQTGFKLGKPVQEVQGVGIDTTIPKPKPTNLLSEQMSELSLSPSGAVTDVVVDKSIVTQNDPGFLKNLFDGISNQDYGKVAQTIGDGAKKFGKAMFTNKDGSIDKAAVMGAVTFAASYAEAKALAADAGIDLTEEEYDETQRDEKKAEYAGYLTNFFGGRKDGGRIGFESGANEMIKTQLLEEIMPDTSTEDFVIIMTEDGPRMILKSNLPSESMMMDTTTSVFGDAGRGREIPQELRANGGRIGFKKGSPEETSEIGIMAIDVEAGDDEDEEDMMMAGITFSRPEKSYLFRRLGGSGGSDRSYTMPNLYRILNNPNKYPEDAAILKEIAIMGLGGGRKDGGRIGYKDGKSLGDILEHGYFMQGPTEKEDFEYYRDLDERLKKAEKDSIEEDVSTIEDIFKRDTPQTEGKFGLSEGFTLSPITLLRRFLAQKELENRADGGRIGYKGGANRVSELLILRDNLLANGEDVSDIEAEIFQLTGKTFRSVGGISDIPTGKIRKNNAGVVERDYRDEGGFVPVGIKERADDVPAMLSKNEFVMTADAVRGIGNGSVEEGSKKLYNTMKKAEQVGKA